MFELKRRFITRSAKRGDDSMTDSEKLDLLIVKVGTIETDVSGLKTDVSDLKEDVSGLKEKVGGLETDVGSLKTNFNNFRLQMLKSTAELKTMDDMILDEIERVHAILDKHISDKSLHTA